MEVYSKRWSSQLTTISKQEYNALSFHSSETRRIRAAVMKKMGMEIPAQYDLSGFHPTIRVQIRKAQMQLWFWKTWLHFTFLQSSLDQAIRETFAEESFRHRTENLWKKWLGVKGTHPTLLRFFFAKLMGVRRGCISCLLKSTGPQKPRKIKRSPLFISTTTNSSPKTRDQNSSK